MPITYGNLTPQASKIYECLMKGQLINRKKAMDELSVQNLTARISEFRAKGVQFRVAYYFYNVTTGVMQRQAMYYMKFTDRAINMHIIGAV